MSEARSWRRWVGPGLVGTVLIGAGFAVRSVVIDGPSLDRSTPATATALAMGEALRPSGGGDLIVFSGDTADLDRARQRGVFVASPDGSVLKTVIWSPTGGNNSDHSPAWSPDGDQIAWVSQRSQNHDTVPGAADSSIVVARPDGKARRTLVRSRFRLGRPSWSPDGRWIAFDRARVDRAVDRIQIVNTRTRQVRVLDTGAVEDRSPSFSPDGRHLMFTRANSIWELSLRGHGIRLLTDDGQDGSYSQDGSRIAFSSERDHNGTSYYHEGPELINNEIYSMKPDGSDERRITKTTADDRAPAWSPDNRVLIHERIDPRDDTSDLWITDPKGQCQRQLIRLGKRLRRFFLDSPSWRPRGGSRPRSGRLDRSCSAL